MSVLAKTYKNWLLNKLYKIAKYLVTMRCVLTLRSALFTKFENQNQNIEKTINFKNLTGSADAIPLTNINVFKMAENNPIKKTRAKYAVEDDSDIEDEALVQPMPHVYVQDQVVVDFRNEVQLGASSPYDENLRNPTFQPTLSNIHETRHQNLVEAIQRMRRDERARTTMPQSPTVSSSSETKEPEVITINSSTSEREIITVSSTREADIFEQDTVEIELEDEVFDPIEGTSDRVAAAPSKIKGKNSGSGTYDKLVGKIAAKSFKKSRNARNKKSQCTGGTNSVPKNSVEKSQDVVDISTSSNEDEVSVRVMGASYKPTNAIRPTPRPDLNRPPRRSPETENPSNDPSADASGNFAWGSWEEAEDPEAEVAIVGFRVPYNPSAEMGAFASSSATSANSANSANSSIGTVDLSEID